MKSFVTLPLWKLVSLTLTSSGNQWYISHIHIHTVNIEMVCFALIIIIALIMYELNDEGIS